MSDAFAWTFDAMASIPWLEVIKALAPVATAAIALYAVRNWQRQDKAKKLAEFLDDLIETTHKFVIDMRKPVTLLQFAKIGMASHMQDWGNGDAQEKSIRGAINYVKEWGKDQSERLTAALAEVDPSVIRLRSLVAKGQVFNFRDYKKCQEAVPLLTWQFERITAFNTVIGAQSWNWEHPEILGSLTKVMDITPEDVRESISKNNVALIEFAREAYRNIYR